MAATSLDPLLEPPPPDSNEADNESRSEGTPHNESDADEEEDDNLQLEHARNIHNEQLKSRFEGIFEKYERDFTGVGDEIDLETGEIVVDNGHLANMRQELDPGKSASSRFFTDFAEDLEHGDEDASSGDSGSSDESGQSDNDDDEMDSGDEESTSGGTSNGDVSAREQDVESNVSRFGGEHVPLDPFLQQLTAAAAGDMTKNPLLSIPSLDSADDTRGIRTGEVRSNERPLSVESGSQSNTSINMLDIPAVKESLLALKSKTKRGRTIDPDAIQALGASIATQIAQFIGTGGRSEPTSRRGKKRKDRTWDFPELPVDRQRRLNPPPAPPSLPLLAAAISPGRKVNEPRASLWAPIKHPRPRGPGKRAVGPERAPEPQPKPPRADPLPTADGQDGAGQLQDELHFNADDVPVLKKCYNCGICATTTWRRGPEGDLCNACGMYLYRYGLMKPPRPATPEVELELELEQRDDSHYSANTSRRITGSIAKQQPNRFTIEEDALIIKLKEFDRLSWEKIGRHFDGRSAFAVQCRYAKKLVGQPSEGRDALIEQGFSFDKDKGETRDGGFTEQDDELLVQLREESELDWETIATRVSSQTAETVKARYNLLLGIYPEGAEPELQRIPKRRKHVDPDLPERAAHAFTPEEDESIVTLREVQKLPWQEVAQQIPGRSALALQKRYVRELDRRKLIVAKGGDDPYAHLFLVGEDSDMDLSTAGEDRLRLEKEFVAHSSLTLAEETLLMRLRDDEDLKWDEIADRMPGRSILILRNRYVAIQEKKEHERAKAAAFAASSSVYDIPASEGFPGEHNGHQSSLISSRRPRFKKREDRLLFKLKEEGMDWDLIASHMPGRSPGSLEKRWRKKLKDKRLHDLQESDAEAGATVADDSMSAVQDDGRDSIDPSLDQAGPPTRRRKVGVFVGPQQPLLATRDRAETGRSLGQDARSYPPTEAGSEISHDPYEYTPSHHQYTAGASPGALNTPILQPARAGSKYSQQEHDIVRTLRAQGQEWKEIASHLPGRSPNSVHWHWKAHVHPTKPPRSSLPSSMAATRKAESTLLRKALSNGTRRQSEEGLPSGGGLSHSTPFRFGMLGATPSRNLMPTGLVLGGGAPPMNLFHSLLNRSPGRAAEALVSPARGKPLFGDSGEHESLRTPTLLPSAMPFAQEIVKSSMLQPIFGHEAPTVTDAESRAGTPQSFVSAEETQSPPRNGGDDADEEDGIANVASCPQTPEQREYQIMDPTPPRSSPFQPTPAPVSNYYTPARYSQHAMPYFVAPPVPGMYSPFVPQPHVEEEPPQAMIDPGLEDGFGSLQPVATASRSRARRSWTPVVDLPQPSDDETVDLSDCDGKNMPEPERPCSPLVATLGSEEPPPFSWNELITMSLKSTPEQRLTIPEMSRYLEGKFLYFKACGNSWTNTLRQRLSMSEDFESRGSGLSAIWSFADKTPVYVEPKRRPARPKKAQLGEIASTENVEPPPRPEPSLVHEPVHQVPKQAICSPELESPPQNEGDAFEAFSVMSAHAGDRMDIGRPVRDEGGRLHTAMAPLAGSNPDAVAPPPDDTPMIDATETTPAQEASPAIPAMIAQAVISAPGSVAAPASPTTDAATSKRGRGRPKKRKNMMPVAVPAAPTAPTVTSLDRADPMKSKRGPGRPRKSEIVVPAATQASQSTPTPETSPAPPSSSSANTADFVETRRGPGRPKKGEVMINSGKMKRRYKFFTDADRRRLAPLYLSGATSEEMEAALDGWSVLDIERHLKTKRWNSFMDAYQAEAPGPSQDGGEGGKQSYDESETTQGNHNAQSYIQELSAASTQAVEYGEAAREVVSALKMPGAHAADEDDVNHPVTSDIYRDPESSPATLQAHQKMEEFRRYLAEHAQDSESESDDEEAEGSCSEGNVPQQLARLQSDFKMRQASSPGLFPAFTQARKPSPAAVYGKSATPQTPGALLFAHLKSQGTSVRHPASASSLRSRSNSRAGSAWGAPSGIAGDSEDELA